MTGGMMGRTSDTRIYNPRSESSEMFRANHEDERPPSGMEDGRDKEARKDKRQAKKEAEEKEDKKIRHIKVRSHHLGIEGEKPTEDVDEEEEKFKPRGSVDNPSDQTMPSGAGGFMTSLAMGAKGPGAARGEMIQMSEPMQMAHQLLKDDNEKPTLPPCPYCGNIDHNWDYNPGGLHYTSCPEPEDGGCGVHGEFGDNELAHLLEHGTLSNFQKSEPMDIAWSLLKAPPIKTLYACGNCNDIYDNEQYANECCLKSPSFSWYEEKVGEYGENPHSVAKSKKTTAKRRKEEGYAKWRPSTGQFERPKGGGDPRNATSRRAKNISRNLPLGRKTGLMRPHLSVEFSHRGLASKQPMSKDPQKYGAYLASQEARKLQGGVRSTVTPHMRHSQRSFISGQTGGGRLTNTLQYPRVPRPRLHAVRAPSIQPPKMKMPHLARPKMPGMVTMSEDIPQHSDILKAGNAYQAALMRIALKEIRELMREKKDKDKKAKGKGNPDVAGAASSLPNYEANNPKTATRPEGGTEDENDSRLWGLAPGDIAGSGRI